MRRVAVLFAACFVAAACSNAQQYTVPQAFPHLQFDHPVGLYNAGDASNRLFVVEQPGRIRVFANDSATTTVRTFLDIRGHVRYGGEMGLLGLAFDPDYKNNGTFYMDYVRTDTVDGQPQIRTAIVRCKVKPDSANVADPATEETLLTIDQPFENHKGGQLAFGPDGYLYIGMGDGGAGGDPYHNGQNRSALLGKILRIDVHSTSGSLKYGIPADNPFAGNTSGYREEIFAYGVRNPWRFSFDRTTGWLWCGDVGQNKYEEVSIIEKGKNYGWNVMEGFHCYEPASGCDTSGKTLPIWEYPHDTTGGISINGGFVYRGTRSPGLVGRYIFGDYGSGKIWALDYTPGSPATTTLLRKTTLTMVSFGVDEQNELYICAFDGRIYTIKQTGNSGVTDDDRSGDAAMRLDAVIPNPATARAAIDYVLDAAATVHLSIHDAVGREVATLLNGAQSAGEHRVQFDVGGLAPAVYYCRLTVGNRVLSRPIVVAR